MALRLEGVQKNPDRLSLIVREIFDTASCRFSPSRLSNFAISSLWLSFVVTPFSSTSTVWFLTLFGGLRLSR